MSDELKVTKESVERAAEKCPQAKAVLTELFPDVFKPKEEWEDVTGECILKQESLTGVLSVFDPHRKRTVLVIHESGAWAMCHPFIFKLFEGRIWRRK